MDSFFTSVLSLWLYCGYKKLSATPFGNRSTQYPWALALRPRVTAGLPFRGVKPTGTHWFTQAPLCINTGLSVNCRARLNYSIILQLILFQL